MEISEAPWLGDHLALDFMNTVVRADGALVDLLRGDDDVTRWLKRAGLPDAADFRKGALLKAARELRAAIHVAVAARKAGKHADVAVLNACMAEAHSHGEIVWKRGGAPRLVERRDHKTPLALLAPIAEAAADLLVNADFDLVRPCEDESCVLWFIDRTKSHRRRWCSMALCGNRHKVSAYRERQRAL